MKSSQWMVQEDFGFDKILVFQMTFQKSSLINLTGQHYSTTSQIHVSLNLNMTSSEDNNSEQQFRLRPFLKSTCFKLTTPTLKSIVH